MYRNASYTIILVILLVFVIAVVHGLSYNRSSITNTDFTAMGRGTWTLLHKIAAVYPKYPSKDQQQKTRDFVNLLAELYPCSTCADHMRRFIKTHGMNLSSSVAFKQFLCELHNSVNDKIGKDKMRCETNHIDNRWSHGSQCGREKCMRK